jgi:hypothetical protein
MTNRIFWNERRLTSVLLSLGALLFGIALVSQAFGVKIMDYVAAPQWGWLLMIVAVVLTALGLIILATLLREAGDRTLSPLGLIGFLFGTILGIIYLALKAGAEASAVPGFLSRWAYTLVLIYNTLAFLTIAVHGGRSLQTRLLPKWIRWASIAGCMALLVMSLIALEHYPAFPHEMLLVVGIMLLLRRYRASAGERTTQRVIHYELRA